MCGWIAVILLGLVTGDKAVSPELLVSTKVSRKAPLWVSLSRALDAEGNLSAEYLSAYARRDLGRRTQREATHSGWPDRRASCFRERPAEIFAASSTLSELQRNSHLVIEGRIID